MEAMKEALAAKEAHVQFLKCSEDNRKKAIINIADEMKNQLPKILDANAIDIKNAKEQNLSSAIVDRLELTESRVLAIIESVRSIAAQPTVVGEIVETLTRDDGLLIQKERIPLGVVGMIFESRPNVVIDCSCLAIKSGNSIILKGGKEANESNKILTSIVRTAIKEFIPENTVQLIDSRDAVGELLSQVGLVDVIIPRGGERLIQYVYDNSKVPVIAHFKGLCHIFVDESANLDRALDIVLNAKAQRPGVCNAMETLLLHKNLKSDFVERLLENLMEKNIEVRVCSQTTTSNEKVKLATDEDWDTEYLDAILSVKTVESVEAAISHIQKFGSQHTEAILTQDQNSIDLFKAQVDASSIMINASTRFNDGGEYGLGAELGISTTKLHAYGPMGAKEMTTTRFLVTGEGHIRK